MTQPHVTDAAGAGIASWVASGGTVFATAGAGMLNEANVTNKAFTGLMGITQRSVYTGTKDKFNATVRLVKQDINFVEVSVHESPTSMLCLAKHIHVATYVCMMNAHLFIWYAIIMRRVYDLCLPSCWTTSPSLVQRTEPCPKL